MAQYRVVWEIDIEAKNAFEAAQEARAAQLDDETEATNFTVVRMSDHKSEQIDVDGTEE